LPGEKQAGLLIAARYKKIQDKGSKKEAHNKGIRSRRYYFVECNLQGCPFVNESLTPE
jgi:hypothetical protein